MTRLRAFLTAAAPHAVALFIASALASRADAQETVEVDAVSPELPDSPRPLIATLKDSGDRYAVRGPRINFVKDADLPYLVSLLDSEEPCAIVDLSSSSIYYPGRSTVGLEAAYLIEGFWKRYYPTGLTSQQYKPDIKAMKRWYGMWSRLQQLAEPPVPAGGGAPPRLERD